MRLLLTTGRAGGLVGLCLMVSTATSAAWVGSAVEGAPRPPSAAPTPTSSAPITTSEPASSTPATASSTTAVPTASTATTAEATTTTQRPETTPPPDAPAPSTTPVTTVTAVPPSSTTSTTSTAVITTAALPAPDDPVRPTPLRDTHEIRQITFPVVGGSSFEYGWMDCRDGCTRLHQGTDIVAAKLQPLVSPVDGVVVRFLNHHRSAGMGVIIRDDDGYQYRLYHLNDDSPGTDDGRAAEDWIFGADLGPGDRVHAGELVGFLGDSGNAEHLAHVHVEIWRPDGRPINPYWSLLEAGRGGLDCAAADDVAADWLQVGGVLVSPHGFRPSDASVCLSGPADL